MSDYLWDKKGEPDAEVERLEALLSNFRHAPRALELPAEEALRSGPRPRRFGAWLHFDAARLYGPAGLAAAAALLLAFLAGAWALVRVRPDADERRAVAHDARQPHPQTLEASGRSSSSAERQGSPSPTQEIATAANGPESSNVSAKGGATPFVSGGARARTGARPVAPLKSRRKPPADAPGVAGRDAEAGALEAMGARGRAGAASLFDGTRMMAKEQLIYALRLTGAKLKEVERKTHGPAEPKAAAGGGVR